MPKGKQQKLKLYYLSRIMTEKTDDEHGLSMKEIQMRLAEYGCTADRKSLYDDLEALRVLGIDVIGEPVGGGYLYHVGKKQFDIAELKLLVDAVQSSKFITEKKSNELIKKLTSMASDYEAAQLKRQVVVQGRVKTMNESIYYSVDEIHNAIAHNRKIRFRYFHWQPDKSQYILHGGDYFVVSPWALTWDDEYYYLIAFDDFSKTCKHYRVDKMIRPEMIGEKREGEDEFRDLDMAVYSKAAFGMYGGEKKRVKIYFHNKMSGVFIDRFGKDVPMLKADDTHFYATVTVAVSNQFLGWVVSMSDAIRIEGPEEVVARMREVSEKLFNQYKG